MDSSRGEVNGDASLTVWSTGVLDQGECYRYTTRSDVLISWDDGVFDSPRIRDLWVVMARSVRQPAFQTLLQLHPEWCGPRKTATRSVKCSQTRIGYFNRPRIRLFGVLSVRIIVWCECDCGEEEAVASVVSGRYVRAEVDGRWLTTPNCFVVG